MVKIMKSNPDIPGCDSLMWERRLCHHLLTEKNEAVRENVEIKDLQTQLLKLQLGEAINKAKDNKKNTNRQMVVTEQLPPQQWVQELLRLYGQQRGGSSCRGQRGAELEHVHKEARPQTEKLAFCVEKKDIGRESVPLRCSNPAGVDIRHRNPRSLLGAKAGVQANSTPWGAMRKTSVRDLGDSMDSNTDKPHRETRKQGISYAASYSQRRNYAFPGGHRCNIFNYKNPPLDCCTTDHVTVVGFSGVAQKLPTKEPISTKIGNQSVLHPFVISPHVPVNLLGRDLRMKVGATILCSADGMLK